MKRSTDRILTTFAGSLVRPPDLRDMVLAKEAGQPVDDTALAARTADAVRAAVRRQSEFGLDVVADGEMSKSSFFAYLNERLSGFSMRPSQEGFRQADIAEFPELAERLGLTRRAALPQQPACTGPITYVGTSALQQDIRNFAAALEGTRYEEAFLPAATPGMVAYTHANEYYPDVIAYLEAAADALRVEYRAIVDAGFLLQLDAPDIPISRNVVFAGDGVDFSRRSLADYRARLELMIGACNRALEGIPSDRVRLHTCWGNWAGPHHKDVPLADIVDMLLSVHADAIYVEAFNPRHEHEWRVWETTRLPDDKLLIVGMIDTKTNYIEHPEAIANRLATYAQVVGRERMIAATDCGFGTTATRSTVVDEIAWAKLRALHDGAALASQRLWS